MHYLKPMALLLLMLCNSLTFCQSSSDTPPSTAQQKMQQLNFMIGNWVGTSTTFKDGAIDRQVPAFEHIQYKVDQNLITIDLHSTTLQLHTIVYYDEKEGTYFYCPYSKGRAGKHRGRFEDGKFLVQLRESYRLVFQQTPEGQFIEYGERLKDGVWTKSFEDVFEDIR